MATSRSAAQNLDMVLSRVIVPLWIMAGAVFKLIERTPGNLPSQIVKGAKQFASAQNLDSNLVLDLLLRSLIGLEFLVVGVMLFVPRLARFAGIFMMACFCAILINEIASGAASCGCFGSVKISPALMLAIDGTLLAGLVACAVLAGKAGQADVDPSRRSPRGPAIALMLLWIVAGTGIAFALPEKSAPPAEPELPVVQPLPATPRPGTAPELPPPVLPTPIQTPPIPTGASPTPPAPPADPTVNPDPRPLKDWYSTTIDEWQGKPWREIDLFQFMKHWPKDLDTGRHYVVFYSRTCSHCHELLDTHFFDRPATPTVLIAIPPKPGEKPERSQPMPVRHAQFLDLPRGPQWLITAPILVAIENGIVVCASEGDPDTNNPKCLIWTE